MDSSRRKASLGARAAIDMSYQAMVSPPSPRLNSLHHETASSRHQLSGSAAPVSAYSTSEGSMKFHACIR